MERSTDSIPSYLSDGQGFTDEGAVDNFLEYLPKSGVKDLSEIIIENRGDGAIVYLCEDTQDGLVHLTQINWSTPGKTPGNYYGDGYASQWWQFIYPVTGQIQRATMLGMYLNVPVRMVEEGLHAVGTLRYDIPSFGTAGYEKNT